MSKQLLNPRTKRHLPVGAERSPDGVHFRVWAPCCTSVEVVFETPIAGQFHLTSEPGGYFSGMAHDAPPNATYRLRLDETNSMWPDPASRFQPDGPHGVSQLVDPAIYEWHDSDWAGLKRAGQVIYEMHVGTFTPQGTWTAAAEQLPHLADLGVTVIELMPIAEFPGRFGWSYDGANLFAPSHLYGTPDELRRFIDEAHQLGVGVILDVVYNHFGGVGEKLLRPFSADYVSSKYKNEWGAAVNFDGEHSSHVREYFLANLKHWIAEYHFDGIRIDATQAFSDTSPTHILLDLARATRAAAGKRGVLVIGENEPQRATLLRSEKQGGCELDALWNDDFHHSAMVRLTGRREAYYTDYHGAADEFVAAAKWGFLFQGQRYSWQDKPRGTSALDIPGARFVNFLQNHDQLANTATGMRLHQLTSPGRYRAMTALLLLSPQTPLLFQGQEFAASSPFLYFNDCEPTERIAVAQGRAKFLAQFPSLATSQMQKRLIDPCDEQTFQRSKLDPRERELHAEAYALHRDLLALRRGDAVLAEHGEARIDGATLGPDAFLLRFLGPGEDARLLVVNFGCELRLESVAQPLAAPPEGRQWKALWSSEDPRYGGHGTPEQITSKGWRISGESATLFEPVRDLTP